jgi:hypothetical protein
VTNYQPMADSFMQAEIAKSRRAAAERAAYLASDDYERSELSAMRRELDTLIQLYETARKEKLPKALSVVFEAPEHTPKRAFDLFQPHLASSSSYTVIVEAVSDWDDFGYCNKAFKVTVARPFE